MGRKPVNIRAKHAIISTAIIVLVGVVFWFLQPVLPEYGRFATGRFTPVRLVFASTAIIYYTGFFTLANLIHYRFSVSGKKRKKQKLFDCYWFALLSLAVLILAFVGGL